ncbi:FAD-dependent oxidoreductase [Aquipuribacter hungaricus]|uniref:FAD-dependent oxidoreductase n=1 Tax=Aquipuribacter hungaricus TaxID=545624 RepID=A0ABV7WIF0_9MICO
METQRHPGSPAAGPVAVAPPDVVTEPAPVDVAVTQPAAVDVMVTQPAAVDVVVIGAGQAGLAAAATLRRRGLTAADELVVLDADNGPGGAWQHRWPSLRLGTAHRIFPLPGRPLPVADPELPAAEVVAAYFGDYERELGLPVLRPVRVDAVARGEDDRLVVRAGGRAWAARAVVSATGTWRSPFVPHVPGIETFAGRQMHTVDYRSADELAGLRVLVVGGGASAVQLLAEVAPVATTTWVTRRPPVWLPEGTLGEDAGRAAVAGVERRVREGLPPQSVVSTTGLVMTPAVRAARDAGQLQRLPMPARFTPDGVTWADGSHAAVDVVLWCTGFRPSVQHLAPLGLRTRAGGIRLDGTRAVDEPRLHLVGYGPSASTIGANRAGQAAAREVLRDLARTPVPAARPA